MNVSKENFKIQSTITFVFINSDLCAYCYNSFYPELNSIKSARSMIIMKKQDNLLIFSIESKDVTAFRASVDEIISFGKIIDQTMHISENF
jgi:tRNA threonylcarbamoyladenosine modification (KEOPS) complex  Pcc1 subunit